MEPFKYRRVFDPLVNVDFGGPQGILLPFLTRIVVHMLAETCPIVGMDFFYTDRCMRFGSGGATELSFFLDGPAGERITAVEVTAEEPEFGVRGLQVCKHINLHQPSSFFKNSTPYIRLMFSIRDLNKSWS